MAVRCCRSRFSASLRAVMSRTASMPATIRPSVSLSGVEMISTTLPPPKRGRGLALVNQSVCEGLQEVASCTGHLPLLVGDVAVFAGMIPHQSPVGLILVKDAQVRILDTDAVRHCFKDDLGTDADH